MNNPTIERIKMFLFIFAWIAPVVACNYYLAEDDKRMYLAFMKDCRDLQIKNDEIVDFRKCSENWSKVYRETFGRNP
jgi:hypothetical protein